jgi:hypothetical protein
MEDKSCLLIHERSNKNAPWREKTFVNAENEKTKTKETTIPPHPTAVRRYKPWLLTDANRICDYGAVPRNTNNLNPIHSLRRRWLQQQSTRLASCFMKSKRTVTNAQTSWPKPLGLLLHPVDSNQLLLSLTHSPSRLHSPPPALPHSSPPPHSPSLAPSPSSAPRTTREFW